MVRGDGGLTCLRAPNDNNVVVIIVVAVVIVVMLLSLTVGVYREGGGPGGGSGDGQWSVVSGSGVGIPAGWGFTHSCALNDDNNNDNIVVIFVIIFAVVDGRGVQQWSLGCNGYGTIHYPLHLSSTIYIYFYYIYLKQDIICILVFTPLRW